MIESRKYHVKQLDASHEEVGVVEGQTVYEDVDDVFLFAHLDQVFGFERKDYHQFGHYFFHLFYACVIERDEIFYHVHIGDRRVRYLALRA